MLELKNVNKYFGDKHVLKNIDLSIKKGEVIAIIGQSGSGKSTLIRCIDRIEEISNGTILFDGKNIQNISNYHQKVGMVFQQFNLFPHLSVLDNIILAPVKLKIMNKDEAIIKAKELLKEIGLEDKINSYPNNLSGGEKQRVAIARTLIMNPEIILFDEPTSSLDPMMTNEVVELVKKLICLNITIIIVSHEITFVKEVAKRIIFISGGKILSDDNVEKTFNNNSNKILKEFIANIK